VTWPDVVGLGALYGVGFCVPVAALLVLGTRVAPDAMVQDYPPAIQARHGPKSEHGQRVSKVMSIVMAALVLIVCVGSALHLAALDPAGSAGAGFGVGFLFGVAFMVTIDVVDLVVFDWLVFCTIQPRFAVIPGTEGMPEYRDYLFHLRVLAPRPVPWPLLLIPVFGVIVGALTALAHALL
jgi:hypothetical protein